MYNGLVTLRNRFRNAFSQIDVQLKRRYDLIPNLVETAKGYMAHERQTLDAVISARAGAVQAPSARPARRAAARRCAAGAGGGGPRRRARPALRGGGGVSAAQGEREHDGPPGGADEHENRIAFARQGYNDAVMEYNIRRETFPRTSSPTSSRFSQAEQLQATESRRSARPARLLQLTPWP